MVKAFFNRYQNEIVIFIWIIELCLITFFSFNQKKYYIIPESVVNSKYQGVDIKYFRYILDDVEYSFEFKDVVGRKCPNHNVLHETNAITKRALCNRWDKFMNQGYFKIPLKDLHVYILITIFVCMILICFICLLTKSQYTNYYTKHISYYNRRCYSQTNQYNYRYSCKYCKVKEYCPYSDSPNKVFALLRYYRIKFKGY